MNSAIDITSEQRKTLVDLVRQYIPGVAVWAYGSRVKWTARPNSDLDLVVFTAPDQIQLVSELKNDLAESELPFLVDLHVWDEIPERFREIIRGEYVVIQEQKDEPRQLSPGSDWRISTWGEEISLEYGKALRGYSSEKGEYRVYGSNGPIGWTGEPLAPGPGIILGRKGAYRGIQFCQEPFYVIDTAYYVVPKTELDMRWLYYAMAYYRLGEIDDGSPIPSTTRSAVYVRELEIPSPAEQRKIAGILGALDDRIELNRKLNETLEATARAIFKSWFVDFDPVRAKAEGREPEGMDAATAALFPDSFEFSETGRLPQGWQFTTLGAEAQRHGGRIQTGPFGSQLHASDYVAEGVPVVMPQDLSNRRVSTARVARIKESYAVRLSRHRLEVGDIIYSRRGDVERHAQISIREAGWLCGTGCLLVRMGPLWPSPAFISLALDRPETRAWISQHAIGATLPNLNTGILSAVPLIVPTESLLQAFTSVADPIEQLISANNDQSHSLAIIRDTLLPRLISGKLRVPEAEAMLEAV
jgi:type I restriction enzyme S subunit